MSYEQHESLDDTDSHSGLIGSDGDLLGLGGTRYHDEPLTDGSGFPAITTPTTRAGRHSHHRAKRPRKRRGGRFIVLLCVLVVAALLAGSYVLIKPHLSSSPSAKDFTGPGTGVVRVQVKSGDGADVIGATLTKAGVVASARAFSKAAAADPKSQGIQPGFYDLRSHMSAAEAVTMLLDPANKIVNKVSIPEGTIEKDVITKLGTGLKVPVSEVQAAAADVANLGLPDGYFKPGTQDPPTSAEGFLYPDTYNFDPGTTAVVALQQMASEFTTEDRSIGFAAGANKLKITPYQALIIASIVEGEAKFDTDRAKVARVIMNRLTAKTPLQIDATSVYAAKLQGLDPAKVDFATIKSPYNTYTNDGLPPTPITNPGDASLKAAIAPTPGNWLFYVNADGAGHLFFTNSEAAWKVAAQKCHDHNWGCAAP